MNDLGSESRNVPFIFMKLCALKPGPDGALQVYALGLKFLESKAHSLGTITKVLHFPAASSSFFCFNSQEITSSMLSSSSLNFSFLNLSYVTLSTRICGCVDWGSPFFPGIDEQNHLSHLKTVSMSSTHIIRESGL